MLYQTHTVVWQCFKHEYTSLRRRVKFDPSLCQKLPNRSSPNFVHVWNFLPICVKLRIPGSRLFCPFIFLHQDRLTGGVIMFSRCPSVRPSVRSSHLTCEHDILKINEQILMSIDTSGRCGKNMKRSTLWSRSRDPLFWKVNPFLSLESEKRVIQSWYTVDISTT